MPTVVLISQGDEVITGQTLDTNAQWLAERLTELGLSVVRKITVGDRLNDIVDAIRQGTALADVVISTGGLGPTVDDLTAEAAAAVLGGPMRLDEEALAFIEALFARYGRTMNDANRKQAVLPASSTTLMNQWGTAPGFSIEHQGAVAFFVPGVPREMRAFWAHHIQPELVRRLSLTPGRLITFRCMGIPESHLEELMRPFNAIDGAVLGFRTKLPENQVKLRVDPDFPEDRLDALVADIRSTIGKGLFGVNCGPIEEVIGQALTERGETIATAESCTGGQISATLTAIAGSSNYFIEGACVYANAAKVRTCGVSEGTLAAHGAVSEPTAREMAEGIRARAGTTYGLSSTGIAGPGGGSAEKPVGTVHIALATPNGTHHKRLRLGGDRERITRLATGGALDMLRRHLQGLLRT
ncbi:MAG: competence/damage-inducible protein A [Alphaproteobacteria bacterium]|nr:competence/damage-inducible protein A [Alphaproteobacteria bacterium]